MLRIIRFRLAVFLSGSLGIAVPGCSASLFHTDMFSAENFKPAIMDGHGTEQRLITQFTDALSEDNEPALRRIVSTRFEQKAMRSKDAWKDLEILNLPGTALEVVESKESDKGVLEAVAKEESGTKYQFRILRDPEKHRWVVDDVLLRQQKKGTRATRSSVEVMDLLLTVREFLDTWQSADRGAVLQAVSTDLREPLQTLPEPWFQQMIKRISSEYETGMARHPEAQLNEFDAVVIMPSKNGHLLMKVARQDEHWLVSDIEVRNRKVDDHPGSVLRQARAMNTVTRFLSAYRAQEMTRLQTLCEEKFWQNALRVGDLSMVTLPSPDHAPDDFEIRSFAGQLTVMIPDQTEIIRMDLMTPELAGSKDSRKREPGLVETDFVVSDVTIYDRQTQQQRNLKSAFTAPARAQLFFSAVQSLDLPMLKQISTENFSGNTWDRVNPALVSSLPLNGLPSGEMTLQTSNVRGHTTELEFLSSAGQICSVIMKEENGNLKIDDLQYPDSMAQVTSMKTQMMLSVPLAELADAWRRNDLESVKRICSMDFNRLVWSNVQALPSKFSRLPDLLLMPVQNTESDEQQARVELARSGQPPVSVRLLKENSAWVIDEISLTQADGTLFDVRRTLRQDIAKHFLSDPTGGIQAAVYDHATVDSDSGVVRAVGITSEKPRGNLTLPSHRKPARRNAAILNRGMDMTAEVPRTVSAGMDASDDGTLRFGPGTRDSTAAKRSPGIHPRAAAATEEHDGVMYFKGELKSGGSTPNAEPAADDHAPITDPSQHPIDIPLD